MSARSGLRARFGRAERSHFRVRGGVTLMELIVALTITGFMAALGTTAFGSIIDSKRIVKESTSDQERAVALRESLREWLVPSNVQIQRGGVPRSNNSGGRPTAGVVNSTVMRTPNGAPAVTAAATSGEEIIFTTPAPNPANAPNARMRLFVDGDEATPEKGLTLEYQVTPQSPLQRRELDSTITSMTVEYLDRTTGRWISYDQAATVQTPKALRLTLGGGERESISPLLQLPLVFLLNGFSTTTQAGR